MFSGWKLVTVKRISRHLAFIFYNLIKQMIFLRGKKRSKSLPTTKYKIR